MTHRRIILRVALFLFVGCVLSLSVATAIAAWGSGPTEGFVEVHEWPRQPPWPAAGNARGGQLTSIGRRETIVQVEDEAKNHNIVHQFWGVEAGWPLRSLAGSAWSWADDPWTPQQVLHAKQSGALMLEGAVPSALRMRRMYGTLVLIPLRPLFPGFALDTAFYAAIALTLWSAPAAIRRHRRRSRGHCPACGYNLQGAPTATCPECGA